jgi:ketosteroid isomerase-like protein
MLLRTALLVSLLSSWSAIAVATTDPDNARGVLERWLEAQNTGAFDAYQKLYAGDFRGVRRSGPRSAAFDRNSWLEDRRRMFQKKMTVEARNVRVFESPDSARIVFIQHWSSGNYTDVGPKQLVLRHRSDGFQVVREELFASDTRKPAAIDVAAFRRFAFVIDGEVVVSMKPDEGWATGPATVEKNRADQSLLRARRQVDLKKLPPAVADLVGSPVRLMDARGVRCEAKLGGLFLRSRLVGEAVEGGPPTWSETANFLVAKVDGDRKACAGATWARSATLPTPPVTTAEAPSAQLKAQALAAFRALPQSQAIQRQYSEWAAGEHRKGTRDWFAHGKPRPTTIRLFRVNPTGPVLLSVSATLSEGGCGDGVSGTLWALWQVDGPPASPRLTRRNQPDESMTMLPTAAVDLDGDGHVELLFDGFSDYRSANALGQPQFVEHGVVRALGDSYIEIEGPETPILICPC